MKNHNGFSQVLLLAILPFLVAACLLVFIFAGLIQMNSHINSICRKEQIQTQSHARDLMLKLFSLNPQSRILKTQFILAENLYLAALSGGYPPTIAAARAHLEAIRFKRQTLDFTQKGLILAANILLQKSSWKNYVEVSLANANHTTTLKTFLNMQSHTTLPNSPHLSVEPEFSDIAPPYRPKSSFPEQQALVQNWQYKIGVPAPLSQFLKGQATFEKTCSTTLQQERSEWIIVTKTDKSSSKPSLF